MAPKVIDPKLFQQQGTTRFVKVSSKGGDRPSLRSTKVGSAELSEKTLAFWAGQNDHIVMYGASGTDPAVADGSPFIHHNPSRGGIDMVLYRPNDHLISVLDGKSGGASKVYNAQTKKWEFGPTGKIGEAGAFTDNLRKKLADRIVKIEKMKTGLPKQAQMHVDRVVHDLRLADRALAKRGPWPPNVRFGLANPAGIADGVSPGLVNKMKAAGIKNIDFIDFRSNGVKVTALSNVKGSTPIRARIIKGARLAKWGLAGVGFLATTFSLMNMANASPAAATAALMLNPKQLLKDYLVESAAAIPQPSPNQQATVDFLKNPASRNGVRLIDILYRSDLDDFRLTVASHHQDVQTQLLAVVYGLIARALVATDQQCVEDLRAMNDELDGYLEDLITMDDNLDAALELRDKSLKAAKDAEQLSSLYGDSRMRIPLFYGTGTDPQEAESLSATLSRFYSRTTSVFVSLQKLSEEVKKEREQIENIKSQLSWQEWSIILGPLLKPITGPVPGMLTNEDMDEEAVLSALDDDPGKPMWLDEIRRRVRETRMMPIPSVERVLERLERSGQIGSVSAGNGKRWFANGVGASPHHGGVDGTGHVPLPGFEDIKPRQQ